MKSLLICENFGKSLDSPIIVSELSGFPHYRSCEPAGKAFHACAQRLTIARRVLEARRKRREMLQNNPSTAQDFLESPVEQPLSPTNEYTDVDFDFGEVTSMSATLDDFPDRKSSLKTAPQFDEEMDRSSRKQKAKYVNTNKDYYEILGLSETRFASTNDQCRLAYRKLVLKYHPDKRSSTIDGESEEDINAKFRDVQEAADALMDPVARRAYDSQVDSFAEGIPSATKSPSTFYETFGECFKHNAKYSVWVPVPELGDDSSSADDVLFFYAFWRSFYSWRDYSIHDEFEPDTADDKFERKWMIRNNERDRERRRKKESQRIRKLVETAYGCDPRILRLKEAEKLKREEAKRLKEELRLKKIQEEENKAEEERIRKENEERQLKVEKERQKKARQLEKNKIRKLRQKLRSSLSRLDDSIVESLNPAILNLSFEDLTDVSTFESVDEQVKFLEKHLPAPSEPTLIQPTETNSMVAKKDNKTPETTEEAAPTVWSVEELSLLAKGARKYPGGTRDRWGKIQTLVPHKSIPEIIKKVEILAKGEQTDAVPQNEFRVHKNRAAKKTADSADSPSVRYEKVEKEKQKDPDAWTNIQIAQLKKGLSKYPATLNSKERWEKIAGDVEGKSKRDCVEKVRLLRQALQQRSAT